MKCYKGHEMLYVGIIVPKDRKSEKRLIYKCTGSGCFAIKEVVVIPGKARKVNELTELPPGLDSRLYW